MSDASRRLLYGAYSPAGFTHSLTRDSDARALQRGRQSRTQTRGDKDTQWHTQSCMSDASRRPLYGAYSPAGFTHSLTRDSDARALQRGRKSGAKERGATETLGLNEARIHATQLKTTDQYISTTHDT